ncbi:MAG: hypothetical protein JW894_05725 [Bacteroidales bacterium]|nr:hypothetical protein [Bacteroidales bacterium]
MGYILYFTIIILILSWVIGFIGYNTGIIKYFLIGLVLVVFVIRAIVNKAKNSY